jgi:hypothetical protein
MPNLFNMKKYSQNEKIGGDRIRGGARSGEGPRTRRGEWKIEPGEVRGPGEEMRSVLLLFP